MVNSSHCGKDSSGKRVRAFAYRCRRAVATAEATSTSATAAKAKHLVANGLTAAKSFQRTFAAGPPKISNTVLSHTRLMLCKKCQQKPE